MVSGPTVLKLWPSWYSGDDASNFRNRQTAEFMARRPLSVSSSGQNKSISRSRRCGRSGKVKRNPANRRPAGPRSDQTCSLLLVTRLAPNKLTLNTAVPPARTQLKSTPKKCRFGFQPFQFKTSKLQSQFKSRFSKSARDQGSPTIQINTGSYDTHATHRTQLSLPVSDCG